MSDKVFKLSPSSFGFLWDECKRCFWFQVHHGCGQPGGAFPKVFNIIDEAMKEGFKTLDTNQWADGMPGGRMHLADRWVESKVQTFETKYGEVSLYIKGRYDTTIKLEAEPPDTQTHDEYGIIDFKTAPPREQHVAKYGRQLHAYALALTDPANSTEGLVPITTLGLVVYSPAMFIVDDGTETPSYPFIEGDADKGRYAAGLYGQLQWLPIDYDPAGFKKFLQEVAEVLALPVAPKSSPECNTCTWKYKRGLVDV